MLISFTSSLDPHINPVRVFILETEELRTLQDLTSSHSLLSILQNREIQNTSQHAHPCGKKL